MSSISRSNCCTSRLIVQARTGPISAELDVELLIASFPLSSEPAAVGPQAGEEEPARPTPPATPEVPITRDSRRAPGAVPGTCVEWRQHLDGIVVIVR